MAFSEFIRIEDLGTEEKVIVFFHDWAGDTELHLPITSAVEELTNAPFQRTEAELRGASIPTLSNAHSSRRLMAPPGKAASSYS